MLLEIEVKRNGPEAELGLAGVLDISTVDSFSNNIEYVLNVEKLTIDFKNIEFVDSTGIGGMVQAIKKCKEQNIDLKFINVSKEVFEIFDILGLPEVFGRELFRVQP